METRKNDVYVNVETIAKQCIQSGVDPINVLSKALEEKLRMDSLVQDALDEEDIFCSANNNELSWTIIDKHEQSSQSIQTNRNFRKETGPVKKR